MTTGTSTTSAGRWTALGYVGVAFLAAACAGRFDPANFEGTREARRAEPEALLDLAAPNNELETLGTVHDSCTLRAGFRRLDDEALSDLDCSSERLLVVLHESAASAGGEVLLGAQCSSRPLGTSAPETYQLSCTAEVARYRSGVLAHLRPVSAPRSRPPGRPAPSASDVKRIDQPDASLAFRISLNFVPAVSKFERRARSGAEVHELARLPLSHLRLGDLAASCQDGCDERALRYGVLIAAGRLGAPTWWACAVFARPLATRASGHWLRPSATNSSLVLPVEAHGHRNRVQKAQAHGALIRDLLEFGASARDALRGPRRQRDFDGEFGNAPWQGQGHGLFYV